MTLFKVFLTSSLKTEQELEDSVFSVAETLVEIVQHYQSTPIFRSYIHLAGFGRAPHEPLDRKVHDVENAIMLWLRDRAPGMLTILGDFGAGKTTLLQRLNCQLARDYLYGKPTYIPILIELKQMLVYDDVYQFMNDYLDAKYDRKNLTSPFWRLSREGRFVVLLDGFDEIATEAPIGERRIFMEFLQPLLVSQSPALMTCRPSYFMNAEEYNSLLMIIQEHHVSLTDTMERAPESEASADPSELVSKRLYEKYANDRFARRLPSGLSSTILLEALEQSEVDKYLEAHDAEFKRSVGAGSVDVKKSLQRMYDLSDLMDQTDLISDGN